MSSTLEIQHIYNGLRNISVPSPTIPPATHTNAWMIGTPENHIVVDPAAHTSANQISHGSILSEAPPKAILLTHHHLDHRAGVIALKEQFNIPIWAHKETANLVPFHVDRFLESDEVLSFDDRKWLIQHTPGHAPGHIVLIDLLSMDCVCGDMVAGVGTIVLNPPEGNLADYLQSLQHLIDLDVKRLHPAHGPSIEPAIPYLQYYIDHRNMRTQQILACISEDPILISDIAKQVYPQHIGTPIIAIAARQIQCHLSYLVTLEQVLETDAGWILK